METEHDRAYSGRWAGPGAAIVLLLLALAVVCWLEWGLVETLLTGR